MIDRIIVNILFSISLLFYVSTNSIADAPGELFNVEYEHISPKTLTNIIGIVTIRYIENNKTIGIKTYRREGPDYVYSENMNLKKTKPISEYGYHPPVSIEDVLYRYPIIASTGGYLCIVYEPSEYLTVWIKDDNYTKLFFDNMPFPSPFFIDIFRFTNSGKRKVYISPDNRSNYLIISKDKYRYPPLFQILKTKW